jgi:rSAM/selenodomain-associated transferase 1
VDLDVRRSIVVLGKAPRAGETKTRLVPPLSAEQAAALYRAFLQDTVGTVLSLGWDDATLVHPATEHAASELRAFLPPGMRLQPQLGEGLSEALSGAFSSRVRAGFECVVLIGSDTPTLPAELIEGAARALCTHDLVIGPSLDGGYYLLGMTSVHPALFDGIAWSTELVFGQTMERARELALRTHVLCPWYDIDTADELRRLREDLLALPPCVAAATRAALARLDTGPRP